MTVAFRYLISGRVQGVGFRYFTKEAALSSELAGWVRNLADGRVEVNIQGPAPEVSEFERLLRQGPPGAKVNDVLAESLPLRTESPRFQIRQ